MKSLGNISPLVQSLSGVLLIDTAEDTKGKYHEHLNEKY
ncbi:MAG: hypothetical protein WCO44_12880 [Bacteroidota bacterium]